jgi:hypothetical protein
MERPNGVTLLALLYGVIGFFVVGEGAAIVLISMGLVAEVTTFPAVLGVLTVLGGLCLFTFAVGAWKLKPWAWGLGIAIMVVAPILDLAAAGLSAIGSFVVAALIVYYLLRPHVRAAFGRELRKGS